MPFVKPIFSKNAVNRAAQDFLNERYYTTDGNLNLNIVENWRASHAHLINTFQAMLRNRARGKDILIAQRHKRRTTIFDKLQRYPGMQLARMQDIAGCRLIFQTEEEMRVFRDGLNKSNRFSHSLVNQEDQYDYVKRPKDTGYRGVHDIYRYKASTLGGKPWDGLMIEIQYRTIAQHAWATAVEIAGNISVHQPKFNRGDERYLKFFKIASEIIARSAEKQLSCLPNVENKKLIADFDNIERQTGLLDALSNLRPIDERIKKKGNFIMYFDEKNKINVESFETQMEALIRMFDIEKKTNASPVITRADSIESLKSAYRNYFSDANDFVALIKDGLLKLAE